MGDEVVQQKHRHIKENIFVSSLESNITVAAFAHGKRGVVTRTRVLTSPSLFNSLMLLYVILLFVLVH